MKLTKFHGAGGAHIGLFGRPTIYREDEKEGAGGSGGDGGMPKDREGWVKLIGEVVHGAISEREKRSAKAQTANITKLVADSVAAALKDYKPATTEEPGEEPGEDGKPAPKKKGSLPPEFQAELSARDKKLQGFEKQLAESKAKEAAAEKRSQVVEERNALAAAIATAAGVRVGEL